MQERRARIGIRHHLASEAVAETPEGVAGDLAGLHATDPATVYLSARARVRDFPAEDLARALYEDRTLVRFLGMRRTIFTIPRDLIPVVRAACTRGIAINERRRLLQLIERAGIASETAAERWLRRAESWTMAAVEALGEPTAAQVVAHDARLGAKLFLAEGTRYAASQSVATRLLFQLAVEGHLVRARPRGSWTSGQVRWATTERWLGGPIADVPVDEARAELARRWLAAFGPGTLEDLRWWAGWTVAATRTALSAVGAEEVALDDGGKAFVLPGDDEPTSKPEPWVALLPSLDPTTMGWKRRDWYLGPHGSDLFDRNGNAGPSIWSNGRVIGGWVQRKSGEILVRFLEDVGRSVVKAVDREVERLREWLGDGRVTPRFHTPLELELSA
jgi:Winged helix DNA-binding domain